MPIGQVSDEEEWKRKEEKERKLADRRKRLRTLLLNDEKRYEEERYQRYQEARGCVIHHQYVYPEVDMLKCRLEDLKRKNQEERRKMAEVLSYEAWRKSSPQVRQVLLVIFSTREFYYAREFEHAQKVQELLDWCIDTQVTLSKSALSDSASEIANLKATIRDMKSKMVNIQDKGNKSDTQLTHIRQGPKRNRNYRLNPTLVHFDNLFGPDNWLRFLALEVENKISTAILENKLLNICPTQEMECRYIKENEWLLQNERGVSPSSHYRRDSPLHVHGRVPVRDDLPSHQSYQTSSFSPQPVRVHCNDEKAPIKRLKANMAMDVIRCMAMEREKRDDRLQLEEMALERERLRLHEIFQRRVRMKELRQRKELELFWARQYQLKLKKKAADIQQELLEDQGIVEDLLRGLNSESQDEQMKQRIAETEWMRKVLEEQRSLETMREKEYDLLFSEEAERLWHRRKADWEKEQHARDKLMTDVLKGLQYQVQENLSKNEHDRTLLRAEKDELERVMLGIREQMQQEEQDAEKRRKQTSQKSDSQVSSRVLHEITTLQRDREEEERKLKEHREEIARLEQQMQQLWGPQYAPPRFGRKRFLW
ncbi:trichoplein keratin filament-binding protein-like [Macrobrachium nipponense]|uniref:trichoplein keratin filament-binding protein-like n=1 Tax=Macrobrachium nipponense TaxID=159736 RepID=UPI0030C881E2